MTQDKVIALTLPDEAQFRAAMVAVNKFQQLVHSTMIDGQDYGVIPGTQKPTLLKPGAEKIAKLLGLADQYDIVDKQENWQTGFFRYLIRCKLVHLNSQVVVSEGLGECNSMESKYRWRWLSERDLPQGIDKTKLITQERIAKTGGHWSVFRFENDDIYSQVNTILKMAKKRALVDAALSAGRLSNVFTQDIEDMEIIEGEVLKKSTGKVVDKSEHWCSLHNTEFYKRGRMKGYAHPYIEHEETKWCNEPETSSELAPDSVEATGKAGKAETSVSGQADDGYAEQISKVVEKKAMQEADGVLTGDTVPTNAQELATWISSHGKTFTPSWACKMLGVKNLTEIADFKVAYNDLKSMANWEK